MSWEIVGSLGEIVGGLGVIVSLLYLARQIKDNTRSNQSAAISSLTDQIQKITLVDHAASEEYYLGLKGLDRLDDRGRLMFTHRVTAMVIMWFNAFLQHERGLIPREFWATFGDDIASMYQHKGFQEAWAMVGPGFPENFRDYVDSATQREVSVDYIGMSESA